MTTLKQLQMIQYDTVMALNEKLRDGCRMIGDDHGIALNDRSRFTRKLRRTQPRGSVMGRLERLELKKRLKERGLYPPEC